MLNVLGDENEKADQSAGFNEMKKAARRRLFLYGK
jgi:hypothetical protein